MSVMVARPYTTVVAVIIFLSVHLIATKAMSVSWPCALNESIALGAHQKQNDSSYIIDGGVIIPHNLTFNISVETTAGSNNTRSALRGCICLVKTCLPLCCLHLNGTMTTDLKCDEMHLRSDLVATMVREITEVYYIQPNRKIKCKSGASRSLIENLDHWTISSVGEAILNLSANNKSSRFTPDQFCFSLYFPANEKTLSYRLRPHICAKDAYKQHFPPRTIYIIYGISLLLAEPFMIITIVVYLIIPKMRDNLLGKALICYLISVSISYVCKAYILLTGYYPKNFHIRTKMGLLCSWSCTSASFWSCSMCFNLWFNVTTVKSFQKSRFPVYCAICYGIPVLYLIALYFTVETETLNDKPGLGGAYCIIDFISVGVIVFNILMFVLTWRKIHKVTANLKGAMDKNSGNRRIKNQRNEFHLFIRMFVIMGVSWIADIVAYIAGIKYEKFFYFTDFLNVMQGFLIFLLFVLKQETRILLAERFNWNKSESNNALKFSRTPSSSNNLEGKQADNIAGVKFVKTNEKGAAMDNA